MFSPFFSPADTALLSLTMKRKIKIIAFTFLILVAGVIVGSGMLIRASAEGRLYSDATLIPFRKTGIVLGCSRKLADGRNNLFFAYRVAAAATLYKANKISYLIVSGDNHVVGYDEATDMKNALIQAGIPAEKIYCDFAGFRTLDSIVRAKAIFDQTELTVISQPFHNQRAIYIARHTGIDAIGFNAKEVSAYHSSSTKFREQFARVKTVLDLCLLGTQPKFLGTKIEISENTPQRDQ
jgi:SanA protein